MLNLDEIEVSLLIIFMIIIAFFAFKKYCEKLERFKNFRIWKNLPKTTQQLTGNYVYDKNPIVKNFLNPESSIWSSPNMINFPLAMNKIQSKEKRQPQYVPNEELFSPKMEKYRPGDWNVNGYTTMLMINNLKKDEGFDNGRSVNKFLNITRGLEDEPERHPTRLVDIPPEGFIPQFAIDTGHKLNKIMNLEDKRYYTGEKFIPSYSGPYEPSYIRDEENYTVGNVLNTKKNLENVKKYSSRLKFSPEKFIPGFAVETGNSFNKLMNQEDQNYYLGEQWFPKGYYSAPLYMQKWKRQFSPPGKKIEGFIPALADSYNHQFNKLMDEEDQNYYLGESYTFKDYYEDPFWMGKWENKFNPIRKDLFKESSAENSINNIGVNRKEEIDVPTSMTEGRDMIEIQDSKSFG